MPDNARGAAGRHARRGARTRRLTQPSLPLGAAVRGGRFGAGSSVVVVEVVVVVVGVTEVVVVVVAVVVRACVRARAWAWARRHRGLARGQRHRVADQASCCLM